MRYLLILLLVTFSASAEIYKTINPDGSVSYSDVQSGDAKPVTPPGLTPTPAVKLPKKPKPVEEEPTTPKRYTAFEITSPKRNETVRDNNGVVKISLNVEPKLQEKFKHTISIYLDGNAVATKLTSANHSLKDVFRGRHSLSARIVDKNGTVLKTSNLVFINMRRFSTLNKKSIDNRQTQTPDSDDGSNGGAPTDQPQNPWPQPADPSKPPKVWPTLPDYSKPQNVWPTPPGTTPPPTSP